MQKYNRKREAWEILKILKKRYYEYIENANIIIRSLEPDVGIAGTVKKILAVLVIVFTIVFEILYLIGGMYWATYTILGALAISMLAPYIYERFVRKDKFEQKKEDRMHAIDYALNDIVDNNNRYNSKESVLLTLSYYYPTNKFSIIFSDILLVFLTGCTVLEMPGHNGSLSQIVILVIVNLFVNWFISMGIDGIREDDFKKLLFDEYVEWLNKN